MHTSIDKRAATIVRQMKIAYGPVPSRRLGQSLGINNVPPKTCSYACVYCQLGPTTMPGAEPQSFYEPAEIESAVDRRIRDVDTDRTSIDYLTFVPDGEPTLDSQLGKSINRLHRFNIDIAVITNGSLLHQEAVRSRLGDVDLVSVKVDAGSAARWRDIDRLHGSSSFDSVTHGIKAFAAEFDGMLLTETMLVEGVNDDPKSLEETADLVAAIEPDTAFVAVPTRPPAEAWVEPPEESVVGNAFRIFEKEVDSVEYLIGAEGDSFASTNDVRADILGITAVHPMRKSQLETVLSREKTDWELIEDMLDAGDLIELSYGDERFYMRPISEHRE